MLAVLFMAGCDGTSTSEYLNGEFIDYLNDTTPPDAILPVAGEKVFNGTAVLQWTSKKGASYYTVEVTQNINADFSTQIPGSPFAVFASDTVLSLDLPDESSTYCWRVKANITLPGQYGQSYFEAMDDAVYVYCPADVSEPDDAGMAGNISRPYQTIMAGIAEANRMSLYTVRVAARQESPGVFLEYNEIVVLREGVSLYGGYGPDFSEAGRDAAGNRTIITGRDGMAVKASSIAMSTVFDGFVVGLQDDGVTSYAVYATSNPVNSLTIKNCEITGLTSSTGDIDSYGIYIKDSLLTIENNTVYAGDLDSSQTRTYGIYNENSSPVIIDNTINGGSSLSRSYGIYNSGSDPLIQENDITGGASSRTYGIFSNDSAAEMLNNSIDGGVPSIQGYGIRMENNSSVFAMNNYIVGGSDYYTLTSDGMYIYNCSTRSSTLINNLIIGGSANTSRGMYIRDGLVDILNNTIVGGDDSDASYGMDIDSESGVWLQNSIILTVDDTGANYGICKTGENNYFYHSYNCYYGGASGTHYTGFELHESVIETTDDPNLSSGYSPQLGSPPEIRFGGVDKSDPVTNPDPYSTDIDGTERTAVIPTGVSTDFGEGWSLGAYECDSYLVPLP